MDVAETGAGGFVTVSSPFVECRGVFKQFGDIPAVAGVDLAIPHGRFIALLGPSGCGKTTLLRLIAGLETPDRGEVYILGNAVSTPGRQLAPDKRKVAMVFQDHALFPHMSVEQNIAYGIIDSERKPERVCEVLDLVSLDHLRDRMPNELSGGQQQRVALARALATDPQLVLFDEPFSNLDTMLRVRVRREVRSILKKAGVTGLLVTHDQDEALSLADDLVVMMEGRIEQFGSPRNVYLHPASHEVATFLGDTNFLPGEGEGLTAGCEIGKVDIINPFEGMGEIMFRPEDLHILAAADGLGELVEIVYFGHAQILKVRLPSGNVIRGRFLGSRDSFAIGQRVQAWLDSPVMMYPFPYGCPQFP